VERVNPQRAVHRFALVAERRRARTSPSRPAGLRAERFGASVTTRLPWLVLALVGAGLLAVGVDSISNDTWLGIAAGREILQHGFGTANTWTRFGSHDWADQQWGAHLVFYGVWRATGVAGLVALNVALLCGGFALCLRSATRRGGGAVWTSAILLFVAIHSVGELVFVRTQSFSVLFFGLLVWLLDRDGGRLERRLLWVLPLLVVWANVHAAVLVGAAVCGLYAASCLLEARDRARELAWRSVGLTLAALLACAASPLAPALPSYLRHTIGNDDFRHFITEWQPVTPATSPVYVVAAVVACALALRAPIPWRDRLLVLGLTVAGFSAIRSELWASLAWIVVLPGALAALRPIAGGARLRAVAGALAVIAPLCLLAALVHDGRSGPHRLSTQWPPAASRAVAAQLARNPRLGVFADEIFADWLLVETPSVRGRLVLDSRFETYDHRMFEDLVAIRAHPLRIPARIASEDLYVLDPATGADGRLATALEHEPGVVRLYRSPRIVVLRRLS
jgi:hypothetical protein